MKDDIRPKGTVEVPCSGKFCAQSGGWYFWIACDDSRLPEGPFSCGDCEFMTSLENKYQKTLICKNTFLVHDGDYTAPTREATSEEADPFQGFDQFAYLPDKPGSSYFTNTGARVGVCKPFWMYKETGIQAIRYDETTHTLVDCLAELKQ